MVRRSQPSIVGVEEGLVGEGLVVDAEGDVVEGPTHIGPYTSRRT